MGFFRQEYWSGVLLPSLLYIAAAAAKSLQSYLTLCNPTDSSPPGSPAPGILQARILEWVAISFSNVWKWKVKVKSLSRVQFFATTWTAAHQAPPSMDFPGKSTGVGCHCLLRSHSSRSPQCTGLSSLHYAAASPSYLCYTWQWHTSVSISQFISPSPHVHTSILCLHLYSYSANRFIRNFCVLDSTYMH